MPSGAKKRKAAKKKKEKGSSSTNNPSNPPFPDSLPRGDDDLKHHDDKESDEGEEEELEKGDNTSKVEPVQEVSNNGADERKEAVMEENVILVERGLKNEHELEDKHINIEHDEPSRKSYDGAVPRSSSSSSSSSDDESRGVEKKEVVIDSLAADSANKTVPLSEGTAEVSNGALLEETGDTSMQVSPVVESEITLLDKKLHFPVDNSKASYVVEPELEERSEQCLNSKKEILGSSSGADESSSRKVEELIVPSVENGAASGREGNIEQGSKDNLTSSYAPPEVTNNTGAQDKDASKPSIAPVSHPVQKASWKNCCGLLEWLTSSG